MMWRGSGAKGLQSSGAILELTRQGALNSACRKMAPLRRMARIRSKTASDIGAPPGQSRRKGQAFRRPGHSAGTSAGVDPGLNTTSQHRLSLAHPALDGPRTQRWRRPMNKDLQGNLMSGSTTDAAQLF